MTPVDWLGLGLVVATIALSAFATYAGPLGKFLVEKTHNEQLGRIVSAAGRIAAQIADVLAHVPAGQNAVEIKAELLAGGVAKLRGEFADSAAAVGATDPKLLGIITGELAKLPPKVSAMVGGDLTSATVAVSATPVPDPAAMPAAPVAVQGAVS